MKYIRSLRIFESGVVDVHLRPDIEDIFMDLKDDSIDVFFRWSNYDHEERKEYNNKKGYQFYPETKNISSENYPFVMIRLQDYNSKSTLNSSILKDYVYRLESFLGDDWKVYLEYSPNYRSRPGEYNLIIDKSIVFEKPGGDIDSVAFRLVLVPNDTEMKNFESFNIRLTNREKLEKIRYREIKDMELREEIKDLDMDLKDNGYGFLYSWTPPFSEDKISSSNYPYVAIFKQYLGNGLHINVIQRDRDSDNIDKLKFAKSELDEYISRLSSILGDEFDIHVEWMGKDGLYRLTRPKNYESIVYRIVMVRR